MLDKADDLQAFMSDLYKNKNIQDVELSQMMSQALVHDIRNTKKMAELAPLARAAIDNGGDPVAAGLPSYAFNEAVTAGLMQEGDISCEPDRGVSPIRSSC